MVRAGTKGDKQVSVGGYMKNKTIFQSFRHAIGGLIYTIRTERNMKIHIFLAVTALVLSYLLEISRVEALVLVFAIALVIVTEMINTAIEATIDLITSRYHPLAKIAKNAAAGAVFISALISAIIGYLIFYDKMIAFIKNMM